MNPRRHNGLAFILFLAFVFVWSFHLCNATTRGDEIKPTPSVVDNQSEIPPGTQPGPLVVPMSPMVPTPADKDGEPKPDDLKTKPAIVATIAGEVIGTDVVEVQPGQLLELEPQGAAAEILVRWNYSSFIRYKTTRDRGHYVAASFTAEDAGRVILVGAVWNGEPNGFAAGPMRWIIVSGHGPQPPPVVDPTVPPVVTPTPPSTPTTSITAATYVFEKDDGMPPSPVRVALNRINRETSIIATEFEQNSFDGSDEIPDQYKAALASAKAEGLPALVVLAGDKVVRVVKAPKTELSVMEAVK